MMKTEFNLTNYCLIPVMTWIWDDGETDARFANNQADFRLI